MGDGGYDPLWARRLGVRGLKLLAALLVLAALVFVTWLLLPEAEASPSLHLSTDSEILLRGESLGSGEVVIDAAALRGAGVVVPAGTSLSAICGALFPGEDFRGPITNFSLIDEAAGLECYLLAGDEWRVARVFVFAIEDDRWLAVPVQFRHAESGRVFTYAEDFRREAGWALTTSLHKRREDIRHATLLSVEGRVPGDGTAARFVVR